MLGISRILPGVRSPSRGDAAIWSRRGMDLGLFGCLVLTPLALGGRHDLGRLVYAVSVAVATLAMAGGALSSGKALRLPRLPLAIGLAALASVALQLVPLPADWLAMLSPGHAGLLTAWGPETALGPWRTVSLAPSETLEGLAVLLSHGLLFLVVINRIDRVADLHRLMAWIAAAAVGMALLAVLQRAIPSDRLLWFYDYPSRSFASNMMGSFANRNHLAHFLVFGVAAASVFAVRAAPNGSKRKPPAQGITRSTLVLLVMAALAAVALGTQSRGGTLALGSAAVVAAAVRWRGGQLRLPELLVGTAVVTGALLIVSFFDYGKVTARLDDLVSGDVEQLDANNGRRLIWGANARAFANNPWVGHGAGSHRHVYPAYIEAGVRTEFTHAESSYLQIATENGAAGLALLGVGALLLAGCFFRGVPQANSSEQVALWAGLAGGVAASSTHAIVDFVWYLPALAALLIVFAASAWRLRELSACQSEEPRAVGSSRSSGWSGWSGSCAIVAGASFCLACLWGPAIGSIHWDQYRRAAKTAATLEAKRFAVTADSRDPQTGSSIADANLRAARSLKAVLRTDPHNALARSRLTSRCQQLFEQRVADGGNPMTIDSIRDAAIGGGFSDAAARTAWLDRAFGDDAGLVKQALKQARLAIRLGPLQAHSYLHAARLAFLDASETADDLFLKQAIRLRPFDGGIRYEAGRQYQLAGDMPAAFGHYKESLKLPGSHRGPLAATLASSYPAAWLVEQLDLDYSSTELLIKVYRSLDSHDDLVTLAQHAEQRAIASESIEPLRTQAHRWRQVSAVNRYLQMPEAAVRAATRAYELLPSNFWMRNELAAALVEADRWEEADPHLRWCYSRRPDIRHLERWLREASKHRLRAQAKASRVRGSYLGLATRPPTKPAGDTLQAATPAGESHASQP